MYALDKLCIADRDAQLHKFSPPIPSIRSMDRRLKLLNDRFNWGEDRVMYVGPELDTFIASGNGDVAPLDPFISVVPAGVHRSGSRISWPRRCRRELRPGTRSPMQADTCQLAPTPRQQREEKKRRDRITVKPEMWMSQVSGRTVVDAVLASVPAPAPLETAPPEATA